MIFTKIAAKDDKEIEKIRRIVKEAWEQYIWELTTPEPYKYLIDYFDWMRDEIKDIALRDIVYQLTKQYTSDYSEYYEGDSYDYDKWADFFSNEVDKIYPIIFAVIDEFINNSTETFKNLVDNGEIDITDWEQVKQFFNTLKEKFLSTWEQKNIDKELTITMEIETESWDGSKRIEEEKLTVNLDMLKHWLESFLDRIVWDLLDDTLDKFGKYYFDDTILSLEKLIIEQSQSPDILDKIQIIYEPQPGTFVEMTPEEKKTVLASNSYCILIPNEREELLRDEENPEPVTQIKGSILIDKHHNNLILKYYKTDESYSTTFITEKWYHIPMRFAVDWVLEHLQHEKYKNLLKQVQHQISYPVAKLTPLPWNEYIDYELYQTAYLDMNCDYGIETFPFKWDVLVSELHDILGSYNFDKIENYTGTYTALKHTITPISDSIFMCEKLYNVKISDDKNEYGNKYEDYNVYVRLFFNVKNDIVEITVQGRYARIEKRLSWERKSNNDEFDINDDYDLDVQTIFTLPLSFMNRMLSLHSTKYAQELREWLNRAASKELKQFKKLNKEHKSSPNNTFLK